MSGVLILEDGTCFPGQVFGFRGASQGEVVFNTGMVGYQEVLTDPSYRGQIVVMTYPLIGNYGINKTDSQSAEPHVKGFIVRENCSYYNNWQAQESLESYLAAHRITGLAGVDTRALTKHLRTKGTMGGIISTSADLSKHTFQPVEKDLVEQVTTTQIKYLPGTGPRLVVIDLGIKDNILKSLQQKGFDIFQVPAGSTTRDILSLNPQGIFLSNGPGDPKDVSQAITVVKELIGQLPICGICLGHQIIALALGADTYKLRFGHRGVNHPVKDVLKNRVYITSQNHGYSVVETSLPSEIIVTHRNLNDGTIEGIKHKSLPIYSVQYHPEAAPGPEDSAYIFDEFYELVKTHIA